MNFAVYEPVLQLNEFTSVFYCELSLYQYHEFKVKFQVLIARYFTI